MDAISDYEALTYYTLGHTSPDFIHQEIVDAWAAQNADERTRPITLVFALAGLYLYVEHGFTGRQVQRAHMAMARHRKPWDSIPLPEERGAVQVGEVVTAPAGPIRDAMIRRWCESVWDAYRAQQPQVRAIVRRELHITAPPGVA